MGLHEWFNQMIEDDLRLRAKRLIRGDRRIEDIDRFYLDLRERTHGRASFLSIGLQI